MKKIMMTMFVLVFVLSLAQTAFSGEEKTAADSDTAIQFAEIYNSIDKKVEYLIKQGNQFIQTGQLEQAQKIAEHILLELDSSSDEAKSLLQKTQDVPREVESVDASKS